MNIVNQNVVPNGAPRRAVLPHGVLFRFGFEPIPGSGFSKVGEWMCAILPSVEELRSVQVDYCAKHNIDEPFVPADYGY